MTSDTADIQSGPRVPAPLPACPAAVPDGGCLTGGPPAEPGLRGRAGRSRLPDLPALPAFPALAPLASLPAMAAMAAAAGPDPAREAWLAAELAQERQVAVELQHAILPLHDELYDLPGLRTFVRYLPAAPTGRVGGDWFITAELPDGTVLIAIGDVGGHGLAAAAGMTRLRGALAGLAITGAPPPQLAGWLNDLVHHVAPEHTASMIAGYFDPVSRIMTWVQAGHPPPILLCDGQAAPLEPPEGILLGAGRGPYQAAELALAPGDLLLLYTDGLVERRDRDIDAGIAALTGAVRGAADPARLVAAALSQRGDGDPEDDTCLVALQVR